MSPRFDTRVDTLPLTRKYWLVAGHENILTISGVRVHLDHLAKVLAARKLQSFNEENYHEQASEAYPAPALRRSEALRRRRAARGKAKPFGTA